MPHIIKVQVKEEKYIETHYANSFSSSDSSDLGNFPENQNLEPNFSVSSKKSVTSGNFPGKSKFLSQPKSTKTALETNRKVFGKVTNNQNVSKKYFVDKTNV